MQIVRLSRKIILLGNSKALGILSLPRSSTDINRQLIAYIIGSY